jgi:phosphatidylethanolamine/phosphatidyl-N-methylethanolamine N-methyltransferase
MANESMETSAALVAPDAGDAEGWPLARGRERAAALPVGSSQAAVGRWFLRKFLRSPLTVSSLWPSSRYLAAAMVQDLHLGDTGAIVELGPGTGSFTRAIEPLLGPRNHYLGIDHDPEFVALLRRTHAPLEFIEADICDLQRLLDERPHLDLRAVLSGLPLVAMPHKTVEELLELVRDRLAPGGTFRTFTYVQTLASPQSWWLRASVRRVFPRFAVRGPIWRNVTPALVFEGRK